MTLRTPAPLIVRAALCALALSAPVSVVQAQNLRTRIDTTFAFNKGAWVDLGLISGDVIVTGWTRPEARVSARIEEGDLEVTLNSSRISIHSRSSRRRRQGDGKYELHVPIGTKVQVSTTSGDVRVTATAGEVQVNSTSGTVEVIDAADRISIETISGDIHAARLNGRTRINTTSGDMELDDISGDLTVQSVSSDVKVQRVKSAHVRIETTSGDITYAGSIEAQGNYEFSAHSGDVQLDIPAGSGANLELQTYSGSISSGFPMTLQPGDRSRSRSGKKMTFTIGNGGARIWAQTFSGDITVERTGRSSKEE